MSYMKRKMPKIIKEVGFDFDWDEKKVWDLNVIAEDMPIKQLIWHFDIPFLWSDPDGYYDIKPIDVINNPSRFSGEYERVIRSDTSYPIDIMLWKDRWLILDGLHRLMKLFIKGEQNVRVRKIPKSKIPKIINN